MGFDNSTLQSRERESGAVRRTLIVIVGDIVATHPLPAEGEVVIGRGQDCAIRVDHPSVSRVHAALEVSPSLRVRDLGSANGTSLRGTRLPAARAVEIGANETVMVGDVAIVVMERRTPARLPHRPTAGDSRAPIAPVVVDPEMRKLFDLVRRVAVGTVSVLVTGESGTGKELVAEMLHATSPRAGGPLVKVNCAAIPDALVESELFGHERGAFTGAAAAKAGLLETAHKGTIFLDEIGELSPAAQSKLLRAIEDRRIQRVGALEPRTIDVRFVAATHRDLEAATAAGRFREDLYYRVAGIVIDVPPLRERRSEIEPLARGFADAATAALGRPPLVFSADATAALLAREWPGNIRELRNAIDRAVLLASGEITPADLFGSTRARGRAVTPPVGTTTVATADDERARIIAALEQCAGNQTRASEVLAMPLRTLVKRIAEYAIPRPKRG